MAKHRRKLHDCPNCGTPLPPAFEYCPTCGQENHELKVPFRHFAYELVEGLLHFDTKVWNTLRTMLRPGRITQDFLAGKRARYVPPVRLYIFVSVVFFFLLNAWMNHRMREDNGVHVDDRDTTAHREAHPGLLALDTAQQPAARPGGLRTTVQRSDGTQEDVDAGLSIVYTLSDTDKTALAARMDHLTDAQLDSVLVAMGNPQPNWFRRRFLVAMLHIPDGEEALDYIAHMTTRSLSILMFILMPFSALLLKVFFARKRLYYEHLIFSIHTHTAFLILFSLVSALGLWMGRDVQAWVSRLTWLGALVYLLMTLHRVYHKRWWATALLTGVVVFPYLIAFLLLALAGILFGFMLH